MEEERDALTRSARRLVGTQNSEDLDHDAIVVVLEMDHPPKTSLRSALFAALAYCAKEHWRVPVERQ
jgi:hypothetical protein